MRAMVRKWGNSAAVRIPASVMRAARLRPDEAVDVREEAGRVVIESTRQKIFDLNILLKRISRKNHHKSIESGPAVGKEVW